MDVMRGWILQMCKTWCIAKQKRTYFSNLMQMIDAVVSYFSLMVSILSAEKAQNKAKSKSYWLCPPLVCLLTPHTFGWLRPWHNVSFVLRGNSERARCEIWWLWQKKNATAFFARRALNAVAQSSAKTSTQRSKNIKKAIQLFSALMLYYSEHWQK